jgi:hypothetical protein
MTFEGMTNTDLIKAIKLLETLSAKNPIAFMSLKLYNDELSRRCKDAFSK